MEMISESSTSPIPQNEPSIEPASFTPEPSVAEPSVTEPSVAEPSVTEPSVSETPTEEQETTPVPEPPAPEPPLQEPPVFSESTELSEPANDNKPLMEPEVTDEPRDSAERAGETTEMLEGESIEGVDEIAESIEDSEEPRKDEEDGMEDVGEEEAATGEPRRSSRPRRSVDKLTSSVSAKGEALEVPRGDGLKLGEVAAFVEQFGRMKTDSLGAKKFHIILYKTAGIANQRKRHIREFCGFPKELEEAEKARILDAMCKMTLKDLSSVLSLFGRSIKTVNKNEVLEEFATYLMKPNDDWPAKGGKRSRRSASPRPPSALALYTAERTGELQGKTQKEISQMISKEWRTMGADKKNLYVGQYEESILRWKAGKEEVDVEDEPTKRQKVEDE